MEGAVACVRNPEACARAAHSRVVSKGEEMGAMAHTATRQRVQCHRVDPSSLPFWNIPANPPEGNLLFFGSLLALGANYDKTSPFFLSFWRQNRQKSLPKIVRTRRIGTEGLGCPYRGGALRKPWCRSAAGRNVALSLATKSSRFARKF